MEDEEIKTVHHNQFKSEVDAGDIAQNTLFFDNLVSTKDKFLKNWLVPLEESWHKKMLK